MISQKKGYAFLYVTSALFPLLQRREHVRHADWEPAVHRGAVQHQDAARQDGGRPDEPTSGWRLKG